jgi:hypothetical protein
MPIAALVQIRPDHHISLTFVHQHRAWDGQHPEIDLANDPLISLCGHVLPVMRGGLAMAGRADTIAV